MRVLIVTVTLWAVAAGQEPYKECNNGIGKCVPYYLCRDGDIITDGAGLIDIRFGGNEQPRTSSQCPQLLDVCCNKSQETTPKPPTYQPQCGRRNIQGIGVNVEFKANQAQFGEFPWMAAVLRQETVAEKAVNLYVCGGSLIHPSVVLTAAHCVASHDINVLKVRLGEWDTQRVYELYNHSDFNIRSKVIHPKFNSGNLHYDYALLILDTPATLAPNIDTICLPGTTKDYKSSDCWATGWGKDKFGAEGVFQNVLKSINPRAWEHGPCQEAFRTTRLGEDYILDPSFLCAGGDPGVDTCQGDGGSPLVCKLSNNNYVQAGIVAWGIGCGENGLPGVYANIHYALDWIKRNAMLN